MREIKFRAWEDWTEIENENKMDKRLPKKMYSWEELLKCNKVWFAQLLQGEHSQIKLMQFTGLKDKNGKEIYEGDIVKTLFKGEEKEIIGEVIWADAGFFIGYKEFKDDLFAWAFYQVVEIIGNKFENPELLK